MLGSAFIGMALPIKALSYELPKVKEEKDIEITIVHMVAEDNGLIAKHTFHFTIPNKYAK